MKVKKIHENVLNLFTKCSLTKGSNVDIMTKTQREMMKFANNKKRKPQFGMMMCLGMVIVMTFYNLLMNETGGPIYIKEIALELLIGFIIALLIEISIVGPCAKKIVFMLPFDKSKKINIIVAMATTMVIGMVFFMSFSVWL